jgi:hypothetical protein
MACVYLKYCYKKSFTVCRKRRPRNYRSLFYSLGSRDFPALRAEEGAVNDLPLPAFWRRGARETTVSIPNQVQQLSASNLSANEYWFVTVPQS